jgi:ribonuclease D
VIDLSAIVDRFGGTGKSLADLTKNALGLVMDKRPRMCCWEARPIPATLLLYAAGDATVLIDIHVAFERLS